MVKVLPEPVGPNEKIVASAPDRKCPKAVDPTCCEGASQAKPQRQPKAPESVSNRNKYLQHGRTPRHRQRSETFRM